MRRFWRFSRPRLHRLEPGDVIVLKCDLHLSEAMRESLKEQAQEAFGWEKVAILGGGLEIEVVRKPGITVEPLFTKGESEAIEKAIDRHRFRARWGA